MGNISLFYIGIAIHINLTHFTIGRDVTGCPEGEVCIKLEKKLWGNDKGANCPGYCPSEECKENELLCPDDFPGRHRFDICDGCPLEKFCITPAVDINGKNIKNNLYCISS